MRLDFYYYSYQCPLNDDMMQLLEEYRDKLDIYFHDISEDPTYTGQIRNMIIRQHRYGRWSSICAESIQK